MIKIFPETTVDISPGSINWNIPNNKTADLEKYKTYFKNDNYSASFLMDLDSCADSIYCALGIAFNKWPFFINIFKLNINKSAWTLVDLHAPFSTRDGAGAVVHNNKLLIMGGWKNFEEGAVNDVWETEDTKNWRLVTLQTPWPRHGYALFEFNERIFIYGGDENTDVWSSDNGKDWKLVTDNAPWGQRYMAYSCKFKDRLWYMGGQQAITKDGKITQIGKSDVWTSIGRNDVWSTKDGKNWKLETEQAPWAPRGLIHGCAANENKMYIVGGGVKAHPKTISEFNDVWETTDGVNWKLVTEKAPWKPRTHLSVALFKNNLFITDGSVGKQSNLSNEVWVMNEKGEWKEIKNSAFERRHASILIEFKENLYLMTGYMKNDIWKLESWDE